MPKISENSVDIEGLKTFLSTYFEDDYDVRLLGNFVGIIVKIPLYFKNGSIGGWSSGYCKVTWNDSTLENEADLEIFDLLFKIDIKNGADTSKIVQNLFNVGAAFEAVKVRFKLIYPVLKRFRTKNFSLIFIHIQITFENPTC